jgi:hypothetical protein
MERRWSVPIIAGLVALLSVVLLSELGPVSGAIPKNGTYSACLTKSTGKVRVINYPRVKCAEGQRLIRWSQQGPPGPQGAAGAQGAEGPQGPAGPADWNAIPNTPAGFADGVDHEGVTSVKIKTVLSTTPVTIDPGSNAGDTADCPAGFLAVAGGYYVIGYVDIFIYRSRAAGAGSWQVDAFKPASSPGAATLTAQVICLRAEPAGLVIAAKGSHYGPKHAKVRKPK